jgi:hypothetical protein
MAADRRMSASQTNERVLWLRGKTTAEVVSLAPRLHTLEGKTVGQLRHDLFRGDVARMHRLVPDFPVAAIGAARPGFTRDA